MTRRFKVGMRCGFHRALYPLLPHVPSLRHHYCQVNLLPAFLCAPALFTGRGFSTAYQPGSQPALLLTLEAVQKLLDCSRAIHISLPDQGEDIHLLLIQIVRSSVHPQQNLHSILVSLFVAMKQWYTQLVSKRKKFASFTFTMMKKLRVLTI